MEIQPVEKISRLMTKYPDRVPVIIQKHGKSKCLSLSNNKFLVPKNFTISQFLILIRKRLKIDESIAIFIFIDNILPQLNNNIEKTWVDYKSNDNVLYMEYATENTFG